MAGTRPGWSVGPSREFDTPTLNNRDEVAFVATVRHGQDTFEVLSLHTGQRAVCGNCWPRAIPIWAAAFFEQFGLPVINNRGVIGLAVTLDHGPVLGGIFVTGTRDLKMLVGAGALALDGRMVPALFRAAGNRR